MSETEARRITSSAGLPWTARGKPLWDKWASNLKAQGNFETQATRANFSLYVKQARSGKTALHSEDEEDDDESFLDMSDSSTQELSLEDEILESIASEGKHEKRNLSTVGSGLLNLARTLNGTEEEEEEEDSMEEETSSIHRRNRRKYIASSGDMAPTAGELDAAKEESSDFINMMSSRNAGTKSRKARNTEDFFDEYSGESDEEEAEHEEAEHEEIGSAEKTMAALASTAMEAVQSNTKQLAKMLQCLSTRSGQDMVLDKLETCCMGKIHTDHEKCTSGKMAFDCAMSKGCPHFSGIGSEEDYKGLVELHSQLKHATDDDVSSTILSQCAEEVFSDVADVAIRAYESNGTDVVFDVIGKSVTDERDISKIDDDQLRAITRNYQQVQTAAFATWGDSALTAHLSVTKAKAQNLSREVIDWLRVGSGSNYEKGVYLGYQCSVAILISIISHANQKHGTEVDIGRRSHLVKKMLTHIETSQSLGFIDPELLKYEITGHTPVKHRKRSKFLKFGRRTFKSGRRTFKSIAKMTTKNEFKFLRSIVMKCANNYADRLVLLEEEDPDAPLSIETKNAAAREMLDAYLDKIGTQEAKKMFRAIRVLSAGGRVFYNFRMALRVMALLASSLLISKSAYKGIASPLVAQNLTDLGGFLPTAIENAGLDVRAYKHLGGMARRSPSGIDFEKSNSTKLKSGLGGATVLASGIPHPTLPPQDKILEKHERDFITRAVLSAVDFRNDVMHQEFESGKSWAGKESQKSSLPKQFTFAVVIPEERKFRNPKTRKVTLDNAFRWVMQEPNIPTVDSPNTYRKPSVHRVWTSLPDERDPDVSLESPGRFKFRFYPKTRRLERMATAMPPKHSSYMDEDGKVVRLKTNRDKKHVYVSDPFKPSDAISKNLLSDLDIHVPSSVHFTFRRSFG